MQRYLVIIGSLTRVTLKKPAKFGGFYRLSVLGTVRRLRIQPGNFQGIRRCRPQRLRRPSAAIETIAYYPITEPPPMSLTVETLKVIRFVSRLPLDVATHAGLLSLRQGLTSPNGVHRRPKVRSRYRYTVSRAGIIHLASVNEFAVFVKKGKIRGFAAQRQHC